jgi:hypothetical protein
MRREKVAIDKYDYSAMSSIERRERYRGEGTVMRRSNGIEKREMLC